MAPLLVPLFAALFLALPCWGLAQAPRPNVILIVADDLGWADLGSYGQTMIATPRLDTLAEQGLRFTQAYAGAPMCAPSRCALMLGVHTGHCVVDRNAGDDIPLRAEDTTVAEVLTAAGYASGFLGKWGLGGALVTGAPADTYSAPWNQGFEARSFGYLDQTSVHDYYPEELWDEDVLVAYPENANDARVTYSQDLIVQEALDFIQSHAGDPDPFFLYLALTWPHTDLVDPPGTNPYASQPWPAVEKTFAFMIHAMDVAVGRIVDRVDSLAIASDTLIIFASDNGPLNTQGHQREFFDSNGVLRLGKYSVYEGGIRVPFIARWPGTVTPGETDRIVTFWDVLPTLAELADAQAPSGIDGVSFAPTLTSTGVQLPVGPLYWEFQYSNSVAPVRQAVRSGDWKLVAQDNGTNLLYDLATDLGELTNVASQHPAVVAQLLSDANAATTGPLPVAPGVLVLGDDARGDRSSYVLDITAPIGAPPETRIFSVANGATGYAHLIQGSVDASAVAEPRLAVDSGSFPYLVDGAQVPFKVVLDTASAGAFPDQIVTVTAQHKTDGIDAVHSPLELRIRGGVCDPAADADCDLSPDAIDNCPNVRNLDQAESGQFPGVGCACLCGDPNRDCLINIGDAPEAQGAGLVPPLPPLSPSFDVDFCDVNGDGLCNVGDSSEMQRAGLTPPLPPLSPLFDVTGCAGYQGPQS